MQIEKKMDGNKLTLTLNGEMHTKEAEEFKNVFREATEENPGINDITLDLHDLKYVPSSGLRVFMEMVRFINGKGSIRTIGANETVMEALDVTGIGKYLDIL